MVDDRPNACTMARFAVDSAFAGLELVDRTKPHEEQAFFLAMGLITNTRAVFFALVNRDAKKSEAHRVAIANWRKTDVPELRRFKRIIVTVRDQFTKEFAATPLVVTATSNHGPPTYEIPIYIPFSPQIDEVLTEKERSMRSLLSRRDPDLMMRVDLAKECRAALVVWQAELEKIEAQILQAQEHCA